MSVPGWGRGTESFIAWSAFQADYYADLPFDTYLVRVVARYHSDAWFQPNKTVWHSKMVNMHCTKPNRAKVRALVSRVLRLKDLEDTPIFPASKGDFNTDRW